MLDSLRLSTKRQIESARLPPFAVRLLRRRALSVPPDARTGPNHTIAY